MFDLDSIKSGEPLSDEQLKDLLGKKEEKVESSLPENVDMGKEPALRYNPETATFEPVDDKIRGLREKRARLQIRNDPLASKQAELKQGLKDIGVQVGKMGKTGDSRTGEITDEHKKIAESQSEDAKDIMLRNRKQRQ